MSAVQKINWTSLLANLKPETLAAVNAFRRRHTDLTKQITDLKEHDQAIDFARYRNILKNSIVVDNAEKAWNAFTPAKFDIAEQTKIITEQQKLAVAAAQATEERVKVEMAELGDLLKNIESARSLEELTVDDVANIMPEVDRYTGEMAKRGQWTVPGYYEKFGEFKVGF